MQGCSTNRKTPYKWCLEKEIRPLDLTEEYYDRFMMSKMDEMEFIVFIEKFKVKVNSTPRKPDKFLELRMYGFVPYNLSDIQKGIQFGHAVVEYSREYYDEQYKSFSDNWKTFIILNGGTSNDGTMGLGLTPEYYVGSMNRILEELESNGIKYSTFREPDANNMLTAIVFIVDERVFNKELYPNFKSSPYPWLENGRKNPSQREMDQWEAENSKNYEAWVVKIGGPKNAFLRQLLEGKRLA